MMSKDLLYEVKIESKKFLKEAGAGKYRAVNVSEFMNLVPENNLEDSVHVRDFELEQVPLTQVYVELNGEYIYSTTIN